MQLWRATCGAGIILGIHFCQAAKQVLVGSPHLIPVCQVLVWVIPLIYLQAGIAISA